MGRPTVIVKHGTDPIGPKSCANSALSVVIRYSVAAAAASAAPVAGKDGFIDRRHAADVMNWEV